MNLIPVGNQDFPIWDFLFKYTKYWWYIEIVKSYFVRSQRKICGPCATEYPDYPGVAIDWLWSWHWACAWEVPISYLGWFIAILIEVFHEFLHTNQARAKTVTWNRSLVQGFTNARVLVVQATKFYGDAQWCRHNYIYYLNKKCVSIHMHRAKAPSK
jgi:hypothetical protein